VGQIVISVQGSFGRENGTKTFVAMNHGHADAVAQAIEYLSKELLPFATALDHKLHEAKVGPRYGFDREKRNVEETNKV
jgi:hypothetical protein